MDYKKAVEAALKGNESAFSALYESTQRDMYYIALKYMKNEEDAIHKGMAVAGNFERPCKFSGMVWTHCGKHCQKCAGKKTSHAVFPA